MANPLCSLGLDVTRDIAYSNLVLDLRGRVVVIKSVVPALPPTLCTVDQADNAALSSRLQEVSDLLADKEAELRGRLDMNELQLKEQIVFNVSAACDE